ncbi:MAG: hypothetical protein EHM45_10855 [Desulfobacteraceae bacterium]|nr:MAG: hypothetical protein EHM45_10855 [Desulfobacteraceae bacterium]
MDEFSKLGSGSKIPPIGSQVFKVPKKRKADDQGRRSRQEPAHDREKEDDVKKQLIDIKDTDSKEPESKPETEASENETGYEGHARPKKTYNPKVDVVI